MVNSLLNPGAITSILGEIVSWDFRGHSHKESEVRDALRVSGMPVELCPDFKPRNAFKRAIQELKDERVIRMFSEDKLTVQFQFTRESKDERQINYAKEAIITLDKATGDVTCTERPDLAASAKVKLDEKMSARTPSDLHRVIERYMEERKGDLFLIRSAGGCYFVPNNHKDASDRIDSFCSLLGAEYRRFPIAAGMGGEKSVKESIGEGIEKTLAEYQQIATEFDPLAQRQCKMANLIEKVKLVKLKLEAYGLLLNESKSRLAEKTAEVEGIIRQKVLVATSQPKADEPKSDEPKAEVTTETETAQPETVEGNVAA